MNYLIYIERSAENLQFFLWYRDYTRRFSDAKTADIALAPEWTPAMAAEADARIKKEHAEKARRASKEVAGMFKGTDFEKDTDFAKDSVTIIEKPPSPAGEAFASAGVKAPCKLPCLSEHCGSLSHPELTQPKSRSNPSAGKSTGLSRLTSRTARHASSISRSTSKRPSYKRFRSLPTPQPLEGSRSRSRRRCASKRTRISSAGPSATATQQGCTLRKDSGPGLF